MAPDGSTVTGTSGVHGWTNSSVLAFAGGGDPLAVAASTAQTLLTESIKAGVPAPPVDPFALARMLGLKLRPANDVADAEILHDVDADETPDGLSAPLTRFVPTHRRLTIAYNPTRPRGRLRFSLAHEIAHALFPDVADAVRQRTALGAIPGAAPAGHQGVHTRRTEDGWRSERTTSRGGGEAAEGPEDNDAWELELLCNVIAAELLMPAEAVAGLADIDTDIDFLMSARRQWDVSTEALLRRLVGVSKRPLTLVAASRVSNRHDAPIRVDYVVSGPVATSAGAPMIARGDQFGHQSVLASCTAVGETARGRLDASGHHGSVQVVGIPGYPGARYPRVLALLEPDGHSRPHHGTMQDSVSANLAYVTGDLLDIDFEGRAIVIAHVVTDGARTWARRGFAAALARKFPQAGAAFRAWAVSDPAHLTLGNVHVCEQRIGTRKVLVASLVAQRGYGPGELTRLRYDALAATLSRLADLAGQVQGEVHVPRLGAGQAGGRWDMIEALLREHLADNGVSVTVHTLPAAAGGAGARP